MAQNDTNKEVNALSDDFLGQVAGGRSISDKAAKSEFKQAIEQAKINPFIDAINLDPNRSWNPDKQFGLN